MFYSFFIIPHKKFNGLFSKNKWRDVSTQRLNSSSPNGSGRNMIRTSSGKNLSQKKQREPIEEDQQE